MTDTTFRDLLREAIAQADEQMRDGWKPCQQGRDDLETARGIVSRGKSEISARAFLALLIDKQSYSRGRLDRHAQALHDRIADALRVSRGR